MYSLAEIAIPIVLSLSRMLLGILLFSSSLMLREKWYLRAPLLFVGLCALYTAFALVPSGENGVRWDEAIQLVAFSALLFGTVLAFWSVYDASVWTALFCCVEGYTTQNLASGITELACFLTATPNPSLGEPYTIARYAIAFACMLVTYIPSYLLVGRRLTRRGALLVDNHAMLLMMAVVIIVIIGFDLLVKGFTAEGISIYEFVTLRTFHGLACVFTIVISYELLVNKRLEAERDTMRQVLDERTRQYEASRASITAVNARIHHLRHHLLRELADDKAGVSRQTLAHVAREIGVYDAMVNTGSDALDTILTERRLVCAQQGIALTFVADGTLLLAMDPADVYALVGTLLDIALSSSKEMGSDGSISFMVREQMGAPLIRIECFGSATSLQSEDLSRAERIARRYGGTVAVGQQQDHLQVSTLLLGAE